MVRTAVVYAGVSVFCLIFYLIYNRFSHGVHSPWMTWLFLWPLCLGAIPAGLMCFLPTPKLVSRRLWHSGVSAITVSSALRGIFDIAGTASIYLSYLMNAGFIMLAAGWISYLYTLIFNRR